MTALGNEASRLFELRSGPTHALAGQADAVAAACHAMAVRFHRGGKLVVFGTGGASTDAQHVAVEFVHPVIVGKRALPAISLTSDVATVTGIAERAGVDAIFAHQIRFLADPADIALGLDPDGHSTAVLAGLETARELGLLTVALTGGDGGAIATSKAVDHVLVAASADPRVVKEMHVTAYHVLWELVHVFFEHRGLLAGREERRSHDAGASSFLYPFLAEREDNLSQVLDDVRRSVLMKAQEIGELRGQTLGDNAAILVAAATALRERLQRGGTLLALGNGGSATDAMDVVADFRAGSAGGGGWPALDLTEDPGILTAIANDIGPEAIFSRQVIAYGGERGAVLALSTSGGSANVISALAQARRDGLLTIAMVGYDGGRNATERLAVYVAVTRSQHIPRIQEAQASAYHVLRELVG